MTSCQQAQAQECASTTDETTTTQISQRCAIERFAPRVGHALAHQLGQSCFAAPQSLPEIGSRRSMLCQGCLDASTGGWQDVSWTTSTTGSRLGCCWCFAHCFRPCTKAFRSTNG